MRSLDLVKDSQLNTCHVIIPVEQIVYLYSQLHRRQPYPVNRDIDARFREFCTHFCADFLGASAQKRVKGKDTGLL